jgi:hypothetical protein
MEKKLGKTLKKLPTLFGGGLGMLNIKALRLELIDGEKPDHARPFPVPQSLEAATKTEMKILKDIDLFNRSSYSEWETCICTSQKDMRCAYLNRFKKTLCTDKKKTVSTRKDQ